MNRAIGLVALGGLLTVGADLQAHHAVASVYDLNKEVVIEGQLTKLNFVNPHPNMLVAVPNPDGTVTEWTLTTASIQNLTRQGINKRFDQAGRKPQDHDPAREKRKPVRVRPPAGSRRQNVRSRYRLTTARIHFSLAC